MTSEVTWETKILLTTENYALWLLPMKAKLHKMKSLTIVTGAVVCPDPKDDKVNAALYTQLNEDAYAEIIQHLNQENLALVSTKLPSKDEFNGYALWQLLKAQYAGSDLTSRTTALKTFLALEYDTFKTFLSLVRAANQKITLSGLVMDDQVKNLLMLDKLPKSFHAFKTNVSMHFETKPFEHILKRLEDYAIQNNLNARLTSSTPDTTLALLSSTKACTHCKKTGHQPANCWIKYPKRAPKTPAAHLTVQDNFTQLQEQQSSTNPTDFSFFRTANGVRHHIDEIRYENIRYF
jgi:hypothetical protein